MIRRSTWITLGVFIILLVFAIYWTNFRSTETTIEPTPLPESPWSLSFAEIESVKISNYEQGKSLELRRNSEGNWVESSHDGDVDAGTVEQAISWLAAPIVNRVVMTEGGLAQFGLDEPRGIITVFTYDGDAKVLLIGDISPIGNLTYVIMPQTYNVLLINNIDVDSIMDLVGMELHLPPLPEETQTDMEPEVP